MATTHGLVAGATDGKVIYLWPSAEGSQVERHSNARRIAFLAIGGLSLVGWGLIGVGIAFLG